MKIAVYCGSDFSTDPSYTEGARRLGKWIGANGHTLVYGGGDSGLMGVLAKEVFEAGQPVIGVIPGNVDFIKGRPQPFVTELIISENMSTRKQKMLELADAYIALPGGIGTLDEISEAITLTKIGVWDKPCVMYDQNDFYAPFRMMLEKMQATAFLWKESMEHVQFLDDPDAIGRFFEAYFNEHGK